MEAEGKGEGSPEVAAGRVEELKRLEAAEQALADALTTYARACEGGARLLHFAERHRNHAALLAKRLAELGAHTLEFPDDIWIIGDPTQRHTIVVAEQMAARTYHDHLLDMDAKTKELVRDRILPEHEDVLEALTGERGYLEQTLEYG